MKNSLPFCLILGCLLSTTTLSAQLVQGVINLPDIEPTGTEGDSFGNGFTNYRDIDNWFETHGNPGMQGNSNTANAEVYQDSANGTVPDPVQGDYWINLAVGSINDPSVYAYLGAWDTVASPASYQVLFDLGKRSNNDFGTVFFEIIGTDSSVLGQDGFDLDGATGFDVLATSSSFDFSTTGWTSVSGGDVNTDLFDLLTLSSIPSDGSSIFLRINAIDASQSLIDNVRVTGLAPIPEPSTIALALAGLAVVVVALRRRTR